MPTLSADDQRLLARRQSALGPSYRLFYDEPLHPVRGEGVWLFDADGRRYLDAYNNVPVVGHANAAVNAALIAQSQLLNTHTRYLHDNVVQLAERLRALFPPALNTSVFTCTGSEANDLALRVAQEFTGRRGLIITRHAYHGVTMALAQCSPSLCPPAYHVEVIDPPAFQGVDAPAAAAAFAQRVDEAAAALEARGTPVSALLLDTVFASDGVHIDAAPILQAAAQAVRKRGGLFIADEVQGGFCRTGRWWAFGRESVVPDMVTMGKPMGNGHPIAALVLKTPLMEVFGKRCRYFNTFGGNTVSAAVAMAVLDELERIDAPAHVRRVGGHLQQALQSLAAQHSAITQIRGEGLYWGVQLASGSLASAVVNHLRQAGVLISTSGPLGDTLKIRPPLPFETEHADLLAGALDEALRARA
nr:aspartate aminotransferase family protein [Comamonas koreensis]